MKLSFDEALDRIGCERPLRGEDVDRRALQRVVWVTSSGMPGCLNDTMAVFTLKSNAVIYALDLTDIGDGPPRGMASWLRQPGSRTWQHNGVNYRVEKMRLMDLF